MNSKNTYRTALQRNKNVAIIKINIATNKSDINIIIVEDDKYMSNNNKSSKNESMVEKFEGDTTIESSLRLKSDLK